MPSIVEASDVRNARDQFFRAVLEQHFNRHHRQALLRRARVLQEQYSPDCVGRGREVV